MRDTMNKSSGKEFPLSSRKLAERALILPLIGLLLVIPPIAGIFAIDARPFGIPFTVLYLFVVWAWLIFSAARLSRQLQKLDDHGTGQGPRNPAQQESER